MTAMAGETDRVAYLIRHGQSTFNAAYAEAGEDPMDFDAPLSPLGHHQVAELRAEFAEARVDLAVTTPFTRALQTCLGLFGGRDIPILVEQLHRERLGASCDVGRPPAALAAEFPDLAFGHLDDPWWYVAPTPAEPFDPEPLELMDRRVAQFRNWLAARPERRIAVVGHGMFFHAMTEHVFANCEVLTLDL